MFLKIKNYLKELKYKSITIFDCDYDFYDEPIYLIDFEEVENV